MSAGAALTGRLAWGWRICFLVVHSQLGKMVWLLVGLSLLPHGPLDRISGVSSQGGDWLLLWEAVQESKVKATGCFLTQFQKSCSVTSMISSWLHRPAWEETTLGYK